MVMQIARLWPWTANPQFSAQFGPKTLAYAIFAERGEATLEHRILISKQAEKSGDEPCGSSPSICQRSLDRIEDYLLEMITGTASSRPALESSSRSAVVNGS